jgi:hypothetical protein
MGGWASDWLRGRERRPSGVTTTGPKAWVRAEAPGTCPVPDGERAWVEGWMRWCAREFGPEAVWGEVAVPGFVPADFTGTREQAASLLRRVGAVMGADVDVLSVLLVESAEEDATRRHTVGTYHRVLGRAVIELDRREAERPAVFAAIVAHELGHARLIGERRITGLRIGDAESEKLTDLVTVFLGAGVLTANAARHYATKPAGYSVAPVGGLTDPMLTRRRDEPWYGLGYLSEREFGYALAYWAGMRGEDDPPWARHLAAGVRDVFRRGLEYRAAQPG